MSENNWHNLTAAIAAGEPIDFEKLDGRKVRMTNTETTIETVVRRDDHYKVDIPGGWDTCGVWTVFNRAWDGAFGWTLWLDGEIPLKKHTADQLPLGMCFKGKWRSADATENMMRVEWSNGNPGVLPVGGVGSSYPAAHVEVIEVYGIGTFKKESE